MNLLIVVVKYTEQHSDDVIHTQLERFHAVSDAGPQELGDCYPHTPSVRSRSFTDLKDFTNLTDLADFTNCNFVLS